VNPAWHPIRPLTLAAVGVGLALCSAGCAGKLDRYLVNHPIDAALHIPDVDLACRSANGTLPIAASLSDSPRSWRAVVILNVTAGVCAQQQAMEAELTAERALYWYEGERRLAAVKDARVVQRRHHTVAAARGWRAYQALDAALGPLGQGECPRLKRDEDQLAYFIGLVGGANALLEDQAGGGRVGVPTEVLREVGRASECLDDERWYHVPAAIQGAVWAMVPGTAPDGVDPWDALDQAARKGEAKGVHLARSLQVRVAANAGREDQVKRGLTAFATPSGAPPAEIALLEDYGTMVARHESDLMWTRARGYRARDLGQVPGDASGTDAGSGGQDPFAGDPFAGDDADPFAEDGGDPFAEDDAPDTDTPETETP